MHQSPKNQALACSRPSRPESRAVARSPAVTYCTENRAAPALPASDHDRSLNSAGASLWREFGCRRIRVVALRDRNTDVTRRNVPDPALPSTPVHLASPQSTVRAEVVDAGIPDGMIQAPEKASAPLSVDSVIGTYPREHATAAS
jgi:hypothetical protein